MNIIKGLKLIANGEKISIVKSLKWELLHSFFLGAPVGILLIVIWELFKEQPDRERIWISIVIMGIMLIFQFYFATKSMIVSNGLAYEISAAGRMKLGEHLRKLPMGFFKKRDPGDITAILLQDLNNVEMILSHSIGNLYAALFGTFIMSCFLFYLDWRLALALWIGVLACIPFILIGSALTAKLGGLHKKAINETNCRFLEYLLGIRYIKAFGMGGEKFQNLVAALERLRRQSIRTEAVPGPVVLLSLVFIELGFLGMAALGVFYLIGGTLSANVLIAFLILGYRFYEPLKIVTIDLIVLRYMKVGIDRIVDVLQTEPLPAPQEDKPLERYDIKFKQVSFSYGDEPVLHNISFTIPEKSMTALVGPSGSGKTTITSLISRFWEAEQGTIMIGGRRIQDIQPERLLNSISHVFQDVYLFNDTIYNNIKVGNKNATREQIIEAAKKAQCIEFIEKLPHGFDTIVGEGGSKLSVGQRQRVSIARALLKDAPILLLDEATASLDPENEIYIQQAIQELVADKTVIVIAHKLQTIKNADQILVLNKGRLVETGVHDELLEKNGLYASLWREQQMAKGWKMDSHLAAARTVLEGK
ncbi:ABC transporter ATP-binding protein [Aeribacillus composti]|uniref:ABC transporter ATP-binding protein n=1 Tax=Aeribacillus composti TaxID=1868734 RepID=UPI003D21E2AB